MSSSPPKPAQNDDAESSSASRAALSPALAAELYAASGGARYGVAAEAFAALLETIVTQAGESSEKRRESLWRGLHLEELALARGCAAGNEYAWEVFLTRYRAKLYESARSIARNDVAGRELADSLYAELFGLSEREGVRKSKFDYYTGRGSMEGWLRTLLAQEWVNRYRKQKRLVSLEEENEAGRQFAAPAAAMETAAPAVESSAAGKAAEAALAALQAEERFILASYFLDQRTLAEIGKTLGVHESTISRKVEKLAAALRKDILGRLQASGMSRRQAEEAMELDVRDLAVDVRARLQVKAPANLSRSGLQESEGETFKK